VFYFTGGRHKYHKNTETLLYAKNYVSPEMNAEEMMYKFISRHIKMAANSFENEVQLKHWQ